MSTCSLRRDRTAPLFCDGVQYCIHNFCMRIHLDASCIRNLAWPTRAELNALHDSVGAIICHRHEFIGLETDNADEYQIKSFESGRRAVHLEISNSDFRQYYHKWISGPAFEAEALQ